tara:strand:+ start:92 stop:349 length:258 start_codon:yes stop_codon:yes gene_type:complete
MQVRLIIHKKLEKAFSPLELNVIDESHKHIGHIGYKPGGETHFKVEMKSSIFAGLSRLEMHRKVFKVLENEIDNSIHALSLDLSA